ncbi:MAG: hypothetical protein ACI8WM_000743 [Burkholderiaceae bacterium]|jgi:hypothetical protein
MLWIFPSVDSGILDPLHSRTNGTNDGSHSRSHIISSLIFLFVSVIYLLTSFISKILAQGRGLDSVIDRGHFNSP